MLEKRSLACVGHLLRKCRTFIKKGWREDSNKTFSIGKPEGKRKFRDKIIDKVEKNLTDKEMKNEDLGQNQMEICIKETNFLVRPQN